MLVWREEVVIVQVAEELVDDNFSKTLEIAGRTEIGR